MRRLKQTRRETGRVEPKQHASRGPKPSWEAKGYAAALQEAVAKKPDATLAELKRELDLKVALTTLWRACDALDLTLKKSPAERRSRTGPMLHFDEPSGAPPKKKKRSNRKTSSSSTRRGRRRT